MKKLGAGLSIIISSLLVSPMFSGCSSDDPINDDGNIPSEKPDATPDKEEPDGTTAPEDLSAKLEEIYSNASIEAQKVTTVHELALLTSVCASLEVNGPITVTPSLLNGEAITLITLGGTEEKEGQATTMKESQLASFGKSNDYLTAVSNLFVEDIVPKEKPVWVVGISLGGMIAQQLIDVPLIRKDYVLKGIITFGSPITLPIDRKGVKVIRFADANDKVPQMGELLLRSGMVTPGFGKKELKAKLDSLDNQEKIVRTSRYTDMISTHALSYIDEPCWDDVDFLGDPAKKNVLELTQSLTFYPAPKLSEE